VASKTAGKSGLSGKPGGYVSGFISIKLPTCLIAIV